MSDEFNKRTENESASPVIPPVSEETVPFQDEPTVMQSHEAVTEVNAAQVNNQPVNAPDFSAQQQPQNAEFTRMENRYGPYGTREYTPPAPAAYTPPAFTQPNRPVAPVQPVQQPKKKKSNTGLKVFAIIVAAIFGIALIIGGLVLFKAMLGNGGTSPQQNASAETLSDASNAPTFSSDEHVTPPLPESALAPPEIAAKVKPSIVGIVVYMGNNTSQTAGEGTGVIWEEDATGTYTYIITCAHVISESGIKVKIQTENGTLYDAEIVGLDERTDLGVVRIKATGLPKAEFGNSDALRVGDSVFAIGNPGGVEFFGSFTGGYVSAIDRPVDSEIGYTMKCIQHDAAINPGNSGGALVNVYGQVIGINSQKIAATEYEGMGFAIPMASAKIIIEQLTQYGYVPNRPKLGISYYPVSASAQYSIIAQYQGLPAGTLIIDSIEEGSSLAKTKARRYDMIIAVDGKPLTTPDVLLNLIESGQVGTKMKLTLARVNSDYTVEKFDVEVTLVEDTVGSRVETSTKPEYVDPFGNINPFGN